VRLRGSAPRTGWYEWSIVDGCVNLLPIEMRIKFYDSEINRGAGISLTILRTGDKSAPWKTLVIPEDARHLGGS
jgi:hypothetical protein